MVISLSFVHPKGTNVAGRYWPHQGHLGLTPLTISGIVRARREGDYSFTTPAQHLASSSSATASSSSSSAAGSSSTSTGNGHKSVKASHITLSLRCYEARLGRVGVVRTNVLYEHTLLLWTADPSASSRPASSSSSSPSVKRRIAAGETTDPVAPVAMMIPQTDFPFSIVIPPASAGGCSTCHLQSYRVYWRLEATIHGLQATGYGPVLNKHYDVAITRYDSPSTSSFPASSSSTSQSLALSPSYASSSSLSQPEQQACTAHTIPITNHPHIVSLTAYRPNHAVGPNEPFGVTFALRVRRSSSSSASSASSTGSISSSSSMSPSNVSSSSYSYGSTTSSPSTSLSSISSSSPQVMPLKIVATVKRIVQVFDENEEPSTSSPSQRVTSSSSARAHSGRNTTAASLAVPGTSSRGRGLGGFGVGGIVGRRKRGKSASRSSGGSSPSPSPSPSASADEYVSPNSASAGEDDEEDDDSSSAEFDKMDVDGAGGGLGAGRVSPSTSRSSVSVSPITPPPSAISPLPKIVGSSSGSGGSGGAFSLFDRRLPWTSSSSSDDKEKEKERKDDASEGVSHVTKTVLMTESASFPRSPVPQHPSHNTVCAALPPGHPLHHLPPSNSSSTATLTNLSPAPSTPTPSAGFTSSSATLVPPPTSYPIQAGSGNGAGVVDSDVCTYATDMTLKIPSPKSNAHWATGESLRTSMARVRFVVSCKITMTTATGSTETFKAPEVEFPVAPIDQRTRAKILSEYETSARSQQKQQQQHSSASRLVSPLVTSDQHLSAASAATPRNSGESTLSTGSFVTITGAVPSAPNGTGNVSGPNGNSNSGLKLSFFERRSARKTPPPSTPTSAPGPAPALRRPSTAGSVEQQLQHGSALSSSISRRSSASATVTSSSSSSSSFYHSPPPPASSIMSPVMGQLISQGYEMSSHSHSQSSPSVPRRSSARAASKVVPKLVRPRTASGVVTVPGSEQQQRQAPTAPIAVVQQHGGNGDVPMSGSGIGVRRRRSLSPPPPASRPSPGNTNLNGKPTSSTALPPTGSRSLKLDVEHDTMRAWEEELDRIALYSKRRSIGVSSVARAASASATTTANMMPMTAGGGVGNASRVGAGAHQ